MKGRHMAAELNEMSLAELDENATARFLSQALPEHNGGAYAPPCVEVAGVQVYAYVQDGTMVVSVDLETADPETFYTYGDSQVPVTISVNGETVFEETEETGARDDTIAVLVRTEPRRGGAEWAAGIRARLRSARLTLLEVARRF
jgi:hypothetical protein